MKIEEKPFINRHFELAHFKQKAEEIAQGNGEDLFLISPWGRGMEDGRSSSFTSEAGMEGGACLLLSLA